MKRSLHATERHFTTPPLSNASSPRERNPESPPRLVCRRPEGSCPLVLQKQPTDDVSKAYCCMKQKCFELALRRGRASQQRTQRTLYEQCGSGFKMGGVRMAVWTFAKTLLHVDSVFFLGGFPSWFLCLSELFFFFLVCSNSCNCLNECNENARLCCFRTGRAHRLDGTKFRWTVVQKFDYC